MIVIVLVAAAAAVTVVVALSLLLLLLDSFCQSLQLEVLHSQVSALFTVISFVLTTDVVGVFARIMRCLQLLVNQLLFSNKFKVYI